MRELPLHHLLGHVLSLWLPTPVFHLIWVRMILLKPTIGNVSINKAFRRFLDTTNRFSGLWHAFICDGFRKTTSLFSSNDYSIFIFIVHCFKYKTLLLDEIGTAFVPKLKCLDFLVVFAKSKEFWYWTLLTNRHWFSFLQTPHFLSVPSPFRRWFCTGLSPAAVVSTIPSLPASTVHNPFWRYCGYQITHRIRSRRRNRLYVSRIQINNTWKRDFVLPTRQFALCCIVGRKILTNSFPKGRTSRRNSNQRNCFSEKINLFLSPLYLIEKKKLKLVIPWVGL